MIGQRVRRRAIGPLLLLAVLGAWMPSPAGAQEGSTWSFVVTPQVWLSRIAKNGFAPPPNSALVGGLGIADPSGQFFQDPFPSDSEPKNSVNPQLGFQLAAQNGRLTLAGAFQYVDFTTYNDIRYSPANSDLPACVSATLCISKGEHWAREKVDTTRLDFDLAASYFFPDVIHDRVDASIGAGFKFIYAKAERTHTRLSPIAAIIDTTLRSVGGGPVSTGLYTTCPDPCNVPTFRQRVKGESWLYGVTMPMNATVHLSRDATWLLPLSVSPLIGAETRDDQNVVYSVSLPENRRDLRLPVPVNRLDGTTFAYGVTADASVRWIINESLSAYAGMRVQYIKGHETYLAYGPLIGMSYRFGVR